MSKISIAILMAALTTQSFAFQSLPVHNPAYTPQKVMEISNEIVKTLQTYEKHIFDRNWASACREARKLEKIEREVILLVNTYKRESLQCYFKHCHEFKMLGTMVSLDVGAGLFESLKERFPGEFNAVEKNLSPEGQGTMLYPGAVCDRNAEHVIKFREDYLIGLKVAISVYERFTDPDFVAVIKDPGTKPPASRLFQSAADKGAM